MTTNGVKMGISFGDVFIICECFKFNDGNPIVMLQRRKVWIETHVKSLPL